jgi:hypothetical protein
MSEPSGCLQLAVCGLPLNGLDRLRPAALCVSAAARAVRGYSFP